MTPPDVIPAPRSLKRKLLLPLLLVGVVIVVLAVWGIQRQARKQLETQLQQRAELIAHLVNYAAESISRPGELQRIVAAIGADPDVLAIVVAGGEPARVLASSRTAWFGKILAELPGEEFGDDLRKVIRTHGSHHHFNGAEHLFDFSAPLLLSQQQLTGDARSAGAVMIHMDTRPMQVAIGKLIRELSSIFLAGLLLLAALGYGLVSRRLLRPLAVIGAAVSAGPSDAHKIWERAMTDDELGTLARTLRDALARTEAARLALEKDVATRKQVEDELRRTRALILSITESTSDAVYAKDIEGRYQVFNPAASRYLGKPAEEILGKDDTTMFPADEAGQLMARDRQVMASGCTQTFEEFLTVSTGPATFLSTKGPIRDAQGKVIGLFGIARDISARKQAEADLIALVKENTDLRAALDVHAIVATTDARGRITYVNDKFCAISQFSREELIGQDHRMVNSGRHSKEFIRDLWTTIQAGRPWQGEINNRAKDGTFYWVDTTIVPFLNEDGGIRQFVAIRKDITARKQAEAEMVAVSRQLAEQSRQAGMAEVATSVLHNVGNVLNSVNISAELVASQIRKTPTADLARVVGLLREQGANLGAFFTQDPRGPKVPDFLATLTDHFTHQREKQLEEIGLLQKNIEHIKNIVARQQSHAKVSGVNEKISPGELIEDALHINVHSLQARGIELRREIPPDLPLVCVDKQKVLQVLVNLIGNARQACEASGHLPRRVTVRAASENDRVLVTVADNGVGIAAENLAHIFNYGFTTKTGGHGFGLHSGANAAKEMGGRLLVRSEGVGRGAAFTLELPVNCRAGGPPPSGPASSLSPLPAENQNLKPILSA